MSRTLCQLWLLIANQRRQGLTATPSGTFKLLLRSTLLLVTRSFAVLDKRWRVTLSE